MSPRLNAAGIVTADMGRSLDFYRLLGLQVPDPPYGGHVNIELPDGWRLMFDSEEEMRQFRPDWTRTTGNQIALAFECASPAEVDEVYARITGAGYRGVKEPWDAFWGQHYAQLRDADGVSVDLYANP
ncbi:MAG TPA: VOC family protein [Acidimicrobiales bacterium]|nr:VOC family protein [Acidimicrobiales bacterium]